MLARLSKLWEESVMLVRKQSEPKDDLIGQQLLSPTLGSIGIWISGTGDS